MFLKLTILLILLCSFEAMSMSMSPDGANMLIKRFEGCSLKPYQDCNGRWLIGYGRHTKSLKPISMKKANEILMNDLVKYENKVKDKIDTTKVNQYQFDALVSLAYNRGSLPKKIVELVNSGENPCKEIYKYHHATIKGKKVNLRGLIKRRSAEIAFWNFGTIIKNII